MQKYLLLILCLSLPFTAMSQEILEKKSKEQTKDTTITEQRTDIRSLRGRIISIVDKEPLQSAHIVNLNSVEGTITNSNGQFEIPAVVNDTIFISYIGFQSIKLKVTNDLLKGNELEIAIHEKVVNIQEITVKSHKLIGVLVVDAKNVPEDSYSRIHINGLPQAYEI